MAKHLIKHLRTIALVGQAGSGKTSLAEALLARAGAIPAAGSVERGTTVVRLHPAGETAAALAQARRRELRGERQEHPTAFTCSIRRATPTSSATRCPRSPRWRPPRSSSTRRTASR